MSSLRRCHARSGRTVRNRYSREPFRGDVWIRFFFQAEDGIRDIGVTGVQTCALPICDAGLPVAAVSRQAAAKLLGLANEFVLGEFEKGVRAHGAAFMSRAAAEGAAVMVKKIGRASCRERVEISAVAASLKKKTTLLLG